MCVYVFCLLKLTKTYTKLLIVFFFLVVVILETLRFNDLQTIGKNYIY